MAVMFRCNTDEGGASILTKPYIKINKCVILKNHTTDNDPSVNIGFEPNFVTIRAGSLNGADSLFVTYIKNCCNAMIKLHVGYSVSKLIITNNGFSLANDYIGNHLHGVAMDIDIGGNFYNTIFKKDNIWFMNKGTTGGTFECGFMPNVIFGCYSPYLSAGDVPNGTNGSSFASNTSFYTYIKNVQNKCWRTHVNTSISDAVTNITDSSFTLAYNIGGDNGSPGFILSVYIPEIENWDTYPDGITRII